MGIVNSGREAEKGFGIDCSGVIYAVGPEVMDFKIGDRVMAITNDAFATISSTLATHCTKIPDSLSFEEATTMPTVYTTAIYSLLDLARLDKSKVGGPLHP